MALGAKADRLADVAAGEIDRERDAVVDIGARLEISASLACSSR